MSSGLLSLRIASAAQSFPSMAFDSASTSIASRSDGAMVPSIAFEACSSSSSASLIDEVVEVVAALCAAYKATRGRVSRKERSMFLRRFNVDVLNPATGPGS
eukprot:scaffold77251_cov49-Phaeocystis_antarctica.AAC.2